MQLFVLGMHRSGTSVLTRLLNMMGAYFAPEGVSTRANVENPKGFWERRDIRNLNDELLSSSGYDWDKVANFSLDNLSKADVEKYQKEISKIILELDAHRPWVVKEPRLCLLFQLWKNLLEIPVCIHVYRNPLEVAKSLEVRNRIPLIAGLGLWEIYNIHALSATTGLPRLLISYSDIIENPKAVVYKLCEDLEYNGVTGIRIPSDIEINAFVSKELRHHHFDDKMLEGFANQDQMRLYSAFEGREIFSGKGKYNLSLDGKNAIDYYEKNQWKFRAKLSDLRDKQIVTVKRYKELNAKYEKILILNSKLQKTLECSNQNLQKTIKWIDELLNAISRIRNSKAWRYGRIFIGTFKRLLLKPDKPTAMNDIDIISIEFKNFKSKADSFQTNKSKNKYSCAEDSIKQDYIQYSLINSPLVYPISSVVDIVVCIHNALMDVKNCLESVLKNTPHPYNLYLIDDGSDDETSRYLSWICTIANNVKIVRNERALGYTWSVNMGLRISKGEYVILLNSDTIVPPLWLNGLIECAESDHNIGIVGPLSNAASWQSIPKRFDINGDWKVNDLPLGMTVNEMSELVFWASERKFPKVQFINGFCFMVKRSVIDSVGLFDGKSFPNGYGEENDYCIRARRAGFALAIADQAYVFHSKSRSFTHSKRKVLTKKGNEKLKEIYCYQEIMNGISKNRDNLVLAKLRARVSGWLSGDSLPCAPVQLKILFVLPVGETGGGTHSIVQETLSMRSLGVDAKIAIPVNKLSNYKKFYPEIEDKHELYLPYSSRKHFEEEAELFDVLIATIYHSVRLIAPVIKNNCNILAAYYIQDYEPWFFERGSKQWKIAYDSYREMLGMLRFAKTEWLVKKVENVHGVKVEKVAPSLDKKIYYIFKKNKSEHVVNIAAMIRPGTKRRGAKITMSILKAIKNKYMENVSIELFGCYDDELEQLENDFEFNNHGILLRTDVANVLRGSDIFIDFSSYQAFGRTGLEAMACGCAVILPKSGGATEYATNGENALIVNTNSVEDMTGAINRLIDNKTIRKNIASKGVNTSQNYSVEKAALSELAIIRRAMNKKRLNPINIKERVDNIKEKYC